jgi:hypothetical protein
MLTIYDYRVTVRHDDSPQQIDTFDHAQLAPGRRGLPAACRSASWSRWMTDAGMSTILICCFQANSARTMQRLRHHAEIEAASACLLRILPCWVNHGDGEQDV